jgi:hypothetical protein
MTQRKPAVRETQPDGALAAFPQSKKPNKNYRGFKRA